MKFLDKLGLVFFSIVILLISVLLCLIIFGVTNVEIVFDVLKLITTENAKGITLAISIVMIVWAIKCIFFNGESKESIQARDGILLENENGKLLVSKDTIESIAKSVVKSFGSAETVMTKVDVDPESKIKIFITLFVNPEAVIKDLSSKLQKNVKDAIKKSLDLEVTEVNIRIKNIVVKKEPTIKE